MAEEIRCPECGRETFDESVERGYRGGMCMGTGSDECREEIASMDNTGAYWKSRATRAEQLASMARHFVIKPSPVATVPGPDDGGEPYEVEVDRVEIGASGADGLFRVVAFFGGGPFAELIAPVLGRDGKWHERPSEETEGFGALTGFATAAEAFEALARHAQHVAARKETP
jgi:hypothetical protein